jgi:hypothetical protein
MTRTAPHRRGFFNRPVFPHHVTGQSGSGRLLIFASCVALIAGAGAAHSGPCTAQIAQLEQQVRDSAPGPETGPTAPQSVGAQLHHQPTPQTVQHAERVANADADAALARAQKADANNDATGCKKALEEAKQLYWIK